jgi:hypothetical protein
VQRYARELYTTTRGTVPGLNTYQNLDPHNLKILYVDASTSSESIAEALRLAKRYNGWLILVYHRVAPDNGTIHSAKAEVTTVTIDSFKNQVALVEQSRIRVLPISAAYAEVRKQ